MLLSANTHGRAAVWLDCVGNAKSYKRPFKIHIYNWVGAFAVLKIHVHNWVGALAGSQTGFSPL